MDSARRHVFLSPHYDDIALSCGGTAALASNAGERAEVALIFGNRPDPDAPLTDFAADMHEKWGMGAGEVIDRRRAEEATAAAALGVTTVFLPFHDAIYRGDRYRSDEQLFGGPASDEQDLPERIAAAANLGGPPDPTVRVHAPLAIGHHVDHLHAYATGLLLAQRGWEVRFYEDLPYALRPSGVDDRIASLHSQAVPGPLTEVTSVWARKMDAIMAYRSQLKVIFEDYAGVAAHRQAIDEAMASYARNRGNGMLAERAWVASFT